MQLTKNFTSQEMSKSYTAQRFGIDNTPNAEQVENLQYLCDVICQPCRDEFGRINVNSAFRGAALNKIMGSSNRSFHPLGCAGDLEAEEYSNIELLIYIYDNLPFTELIAEYFDKDDERAGWVHVAAKEGDDRKLLKLKDKQHNYQIVTIEYLKELYA